MGNPPWLFEAFLLEVGGGAAGDASHEKGLVIALDKVEKRPVLDRGSAGGGEAWLMETVVSSDATDCRLTRLADSDEGDCHAAGEVAAPPPSFPRRAAEGLA